MVFFWVKRVNFSGFSPFTDAPVDEFSKNEETLGNKLSTDFKFCFTCVGTVCNTYLSGLKKYFSLDTESLESTCIVSKSS